MLMNNLDPDVAERPDDLVVYGGTGRAARSWDAFDAIVRELRALGRRRDAARPVGQARRRLPHPRVVAAGADRELEPGRRMGELGRVPPARGARADDVRADDRGLVDLHRQPGDRPGHLRVLRRDRPAALRRLARGDDHADRRPRRHGRRAAARGDHERRGRALRRGRPRADPTAGSRPATSTSRPTTSTTRSPAASRRRPSAARSASACAANAAEVVPELLRRGFEADIVTDQTVGARPAGRLHPGRALAGRGRRAARARPRRATSAGRAPRPPPTASRWSGSRTRAPRSSTTATACAARPSSAASSAPSTTPGFVPAYIRPLFCEGKGPFRWAALSGDPADIAATDRAVLEEFPEDEALARWIRMAGERIAFQGLPARICWLGYGERRRLGLRFNETGPQRARSARRS